jgi:pimeloyl-ACP methyl ester carboxylesterase
MLRVLVLVAASVALGSLTGHTVASFVGTAEAVPVVYDAFEDPSFEGSFDGSKWSKYEPNVLDFRQENGVLNLVTIGQTGPGTVGGLQLTRPSELPYLGVGTLQADIHVPGPEADRFIDTLTIAATPTTSPIPDFFAEVGVSRYGDSQPLVFCRVGHYEIDTEFYEVLGSIPFATWHTISISVNTSGQVVCRLDGGGPATYLPNEFNQLGTTTVRRLINSRRDGTSPFATMIDNVVVDEPTIGAERKLILIQGIDSQSGECGFESRARSKWLVDYVLTSSAVKREVPSLDNAADVFFFSYSSHSAAYCPDATGADNYSSPQYGKSATCSGVASAAARLDAMIANLSLRHPYATFDLIGHSMGGMVAAYWAKNYPSQHNRVASLIAFDSPLRGLPIGNFLTSACDIDGSSWTDLSCDNYRKSTDRKKCESTIVANIASVGNSIQLYTIDATKRVVGIEAVPGDRTTLLSSASRIHCTADDDHSSVFDRAGTDDEPFECWWDVTDPKGKPALRIERPGSQIKGALVACAVADLLRSECEQLLRN